MACRWQWTASKLRDELAGAIRYASDLLAALTGYGEEQDRKRSEEAGFDRHFVKPLNFSALQELISSLPKRVVR